MLQTIMKSQPSFDSLTDDRLLATALDNQEALVAAARHKSTREVARLIATLAPKPPVPTIVRKMPSRHQVPTSDGDKGADGTRSTPPTTAHAQAASVPV